MLLLMKPSCLYFNLRVEHTEVRLPHPIGKLLQGEDRLLQANWGVAFGRTQVQ
jgi:hypothetical protein